jgi:G3E family GTPase
MTPMFIRYSQHQRRLPVLLLSGFLGSGKTSLANRLLRDTRLTDTAVAINEFGAVPLDQHLIDHGADKTIVLANGCLCCNLAGDMEDGVMRMFSRREAGALPQFRRLIIEPSGLADPAPIAQAILRNPVMSRAFRLEGIITTVDALFGARQIGEHAVSAKQIAMADRLLITKADLSSPVDVENLCRQLALLNPAAPISIAPVTDADALLPTGFIDPACDSAPPRSVFLAEPADAAHTAATQVTTLTAELPLGWRGVDGWLRSLRIAHGENLLRLKGILNLAESPVPVAVHGVHHVMHPPVQLPAWPDADRRSRIVLITRNIDLRAIEAGWRQALPGLQMAIAA